MSVDFDDFVEDVMAQARAWTEECEPDEDPPPMLFILHDDQCQILHCGSLFNDSESKAIFAARVMPQAIKRWDADYFSLVTAQWRFVATSKDEYHQFEVWQQANPDASMDENPVRAPQEEITVIAGARDGKFVFACAPTERHEGAAPTLGEWEVHKMNWLEQHEAVRVGSTFDFAMEAITGSTLYTTETIDDLAGNVSASHFMKELLVRAWDALGWTPEEAMRRYNRAKERGKEKLAKQVRDKMSEIDPDWEDTVREIIKEHLRPASEEYLRSRIDNREGGVMLMDEEGNTELFDLFAGDSPDDLLDEDG